MGRHKKTWLPKELRQCRFCPNEVENEEHFLLNCQKYAATRNIYFAEFNKCIDDFGNLPSQIQIGILLGENATYSSMAADYIMACHNIRET